MELTPTQHITNQLPDSRQTYKSPTNGTRTHLPTLHIQLCQDSMYSRHLICHCYAHCTHRQHKTHWSVGHNSRTTVLSYTLHQWRDITWKVIKWN